MITHVPYDWSWLRRLVPKKKPKPAIHFHYPSPTITFESKNTHMHAATQELYSHALRIAIKHDLQVESLLIYSVHTTISSSPNKQAFIRYLQHLWGQAQA